MAEMLIPEVLLRPLRAFARQWTELFPAWHAPDCTYCGPDYLGGTKRIDGYGRPHELSCPWATVDGAVMAILEEAEQQRQYQAPTCPACKKQFSSVGVFRGVQLWGHSSLTECDTAKEKA